MARRNILVKAFCLFHFFGGHSVVELIGVPASLLYRNRTPVAAFQYVGVESGYLTHQIFTVAAVGAHMVDDQQEGAFLSAFQHLYPQLKSRIGRDIHT